MNKLISLIIGGLLIITGGIFLLTKISKPQVKPEIGGGEKIMNKKVLFVLAPKDFRDEEYQRPREILEQAGVSIEVASKGVEEASGVFGAKAKIDKDLNLVKVEDYDAIIFIGGPGTSTYFNDQDALKIAKEAFEKRKILAAICIAPSILANAGILGGKQTTAFSSEEENLKAKGAIFTGQGVTVDGQIITASGPSAASDFGNQIKKSLGGI